MHSWTSTLQTGRNTHLDHPIVRAGHEQLRVSVAEVDAPYPLLMRLVLSHVLPRANVPDMYHTLVVTAGQIGLKVLVP